MMPRRPFVVNLEPADYSSAAHDLLASVADVHHMSGSPWDADALLQQADGLIVRLGYRIDEEFLRRCPRLRVVATPTTGLTHVDLDSCRIRKIDVLSLEHETKFLGSITATAELTWGLLLSVVRRIPQASLHANAGGWDRSHFIGASIAGKTLGIIGVGRLGSMVANYGKAFRMTVLGHDPVHDPSALVDEWVGLPELLARSDIVSVHVSLNSSTHKLLGRDEIKRMKRGAVIINTSRGEVLDESALVEGMEVGIIAGAGLDVIAGEPVTGQGNTGQADRLREMARHASNLIITPHIGGATADAMRATEIHVAKMLAAWFRERFQGLT